MIESVERKYNLRNLAFFAEKMKNIEYFIFFGTLLGYYRENNIIDGDDDIDFYVDIDNYDDVVQVLKKEGVKVSIKEETFVQATRVFDGVRTYIDFYFYKNNADKQYILEKWAFFGEPQNSRLHLHVPKDLVFPIQEGNVGEISIKLPANIKECCEYLYGETVNTRLKKNSEYRMNIIQNRPSIQI